MTYEEALAEARTTGLSRCSDAAAMAAFCADSVQLVLGAVSPRLMWEGAQKRGLSFKQFAALCVEDPGEAVNLQWL